MVVQIDRVVQIDKINIVNQECRVKYFQDFIFEEMTLKINDILIFFKCIKIIRNDTARIKLNSTTIIDIQIKIK